MGVRGRASRAVIIYLFFVTVIHLLFLVDGIASKRSSKIGNTATDNRRSTVSTEALLQHSKIKIIQSEDEFYSQIEQNRNNFVVFSKKVEVCRECKVAVEQLLHTTRLYNGDAHFLFIDCGVLSNICKKYSITHHPSLFLLSESLAAYEYEDILKAEKIIEFIDKYSANKTVSVSTKSAFHQIVQSNDVLVIGFFVHSVHDQIMSFRRTAAYLLHEYTFIEVVLNNETIALIDEYNVEPNSVILFKRIGFHESFDVFSSLISRKKLTSWIIDHSPALLYSNANREKMKENHLPQLHVYFQSSDFSADDVVIYHDLQSLAQQFDRRLLFSYFVLSKSEDKTELTRLGYRLVDDEPIAVMMIFNPITKDFYTNYERVNRSSIEQFCANYLAGKLSPHRIKQSLPTTNDDDDDPKNDIEQNINNDDEQIIRVVVVDNYRSVVLNREFDSVVLFYLPENLCRHCTQFLHFYENAAKRLHSSFPHLIFTKMDMFANDYAHGVRPRNFPSLYFFARDNKVNEVVFSEKRTEENITNWIQTHALQSEERNNEEKLKDVVNNVVEAI